MFRFCQVWCNTVSYEEETHVERDLNADSFTATAVPLDGGKLEAEEIYSIDGYVENHDIPWDYT